MDYDLFAEFPLALGAFALQQVAPTGLRPNDLTRCRDFESFGYGFLGFATGDCFWHGGWTITERIPLCNKKIGKRRGGERWEGLKVIKFRGLPGLFLGSFTFTFFYFLTFYLSPGSASAFGAWRFFLGTGLGTGTGSFSPGLVSSIISSAAVQVRAETIPLTVFALREALSLSLY